MGPLKIAISLCSGTELKVKHPSLPKDWETIKIWLSVKVCVLTNIVDISIVPQLSTSSLILDLKNFIARTGQVQYIFTDSVSNFLPIANTVTSKASKKELSDRKWMKHTIKKLLDPEYQTQLNLLGGTLFLMPQGKHESLQRLRK